MAHACNPATWKAEVGAQKFESNLDNIVRETLFLKYIYIFLSEGIIKSSES